MTKVLVLLGIVFSSWAFIVGQSGPMPDPGVQYFQQPVTLPSGAPGAAPNVFFRTEKIGDKGTAGYFAIADFGKPITGSPYSATAVTETTQVLADGNRIVNKSEAQVARDSQGRTWRQETITNIGPLATNAPKMAFITDPAAKANYILDLNAKTIHTMKFPVGWAGTAGSGTGGEIRVMQHGSMAPGATVTVEKKVLMSGADGGVEQRVWVNNSDDPNQFKTESLGTQTIEGVSAEGTRTTHTIPAGQIGNERALEITSEVWTSPDLQMIILSKRNDPRFGETIYKLTDIKRAEPDPSLFQVPSGFTTKGGAD